MAASILLADTRNSTLSALQLLLEQEEGLHVIGIATRVEQVFSYLVQASPQILLIESEIFQTLAPDRVEKLLNRSPGFAIIVMGTTPIPRYCEFYSEGVEYVSKSDPPETLLFTIRKQIERISKHQ
jgi:DNA-binding NarL/FixJ family response regulator